MPAPRQSIVNFSANGRLAAAAPDLLGRRIQLAAELAARASRLADEPTVHNLRVALRRLRAALDLFARDAQCPLERTARALERELGPLRDSQVQLARLPEAETLIAQDLQRRAASEQVRLSPLLLTFNDGMQTVSLPELKRGKLGGPRIRRALRGKVQRALRALARIERNVAPRPTHRARIAMRKLRYSAEALEDALPPPVRKLLPALIALQERLGAIHDIDVAAGDTQRSDQLKTLAALQRARRLQVRRLKQELATLKIAKRLRRAVRALAR
jgi:CHAD domain-containing protein